MAQLFDRSSNALARMALVVIGGGIIALGLTLDQLQRSPWVTRQGLRPDQPAPFSHKHHIQGLGLQCQYCHTTVERSGFAALPPTKTCVNCHAQLWTNAEMLEPVRQSWNRNRPLPWIKVHDLPDFAYFSHELMISKGIGCASCHGRIDQMPLVYAQNSLQMEWCLDCHRNPAKFLRPESEIYNMAWESPSDSRPVWCAVRPLAPGEPTAAAVRCVRSDPAAEQPGSPAALAELAWVNGARANQPVRLENAAAHAAVAAKASVGALAAGEQALPESVAGLALADRAHPAPVYRKFTSQRALGEFLVVQYKIRRPEELVSCEVCHR